tara:strand:- start:1092 stop:1259 length:168 start_codon:yes stop_codon:yes gene_type:complete
MSPDNNTDLERKEVHQALTSLKKTSARGNLDKNEKKLIVKSIKSLEQVLRLLKYR